MHVHITSMCSGPLDKVTPSTGKPAAVDQEAAACMPLSHYHHQAHTFNATNPDCHYCLSPKSARHTEDVTETSPTQETTLSALLTSELAIINHHPLPVVLNRPLHYSRNDTFPMDFGQSCINFACYAPAVEATTTEYDGFEPLLHLTTVAEQESQKGCEGNTEFAFISSCYRDDFKTLCVIS